MIVETSAFVAMVIAEPGGRELMSLVARTPNTGMSAANLIEASIVIDNRGSESMRRRIDSMRRQLGIHIEPVTAAQAEIARSAYREFGRGSGHAAKLNFGDCFAYALAIDKDEPLLFVGDDFGHTDVRAAR
jgi:ribonuclease VapC